MAKIQNKDATIIFNIEPEYLKQVEKICKKAGKRKSDVMRSIVKYMLEYDKKSLIKYIKTAG
jgi:hypothetical protein